MKAHGDQRDRDGKLHMVHVEAVASFVQTEEERIVAYLHDTLEDTFLQPWEIEEEFGEDILNSVICLTHTDKESYAKYIDKVATDPVSIAVKIADLRHNISRPDAKTFGKLKAYRSALRKLRLISIAAQCYI